MIFSIIFPFSISLISTSLWFSLFYCFCFNFLFFYYLLGWKFRSLLLKLSFVPSKDFPLNVALAAFHKMLTCLFSLSFNLKYFLIPFVIYFSLHELFRTLLLSFQILRNFHAIFCYSFIVPKIILLVALLLATLYTFSSLKFIQTFSWPSIWFILVNVSCTLENMCILWLLSAVFYNVNKAKFIDSVVQIFYIFIDFLCICSTDFWERTVKFSNLN